MIVSILLDKLIQNSNGDTFHFDDRTFPLALLKEIILRGFQVQNHNPFVHQRKECPGGVSQGSGEQFPRAEHRCLCVTFTHDGYGNVLRNGNGISEGETTLQFNFKLHQSLMDGTYCLV